MAPEGPLVVFNICRIGDKADIRSSNKIDCKHSCSRDNNLPEYGKMVFQSHKVVVRKYARKLVDGRRKAKEDNYFESLQIVEVCELIVAVTAAICDEDSARSILEAADSHIVSEDLDYDG